MPPEIFLPVSVICAGIVLFRYYRIKRIASGFGWVLILLAVGGFGSGLAESFAWSGLVFLFSGGAGIVLLLQDLAFRRQAKRRQQQARQLDLERES